MKKKIVTLLLAGLLGIVGLTGCGSDKGTADTATSNKENTSEAVTTDNSSTGDKDEGAVLRIGAQPYPLYSSVYVAYELGYLKEEFDAIGASYEWNEFDSGPLVNEAVAAGEADMGFMADLPAIISKSTGQNMK